MLLFLNGISWPVVTFKNYAMRSQRGTSATIPGFDILGDIKAKDRHPPPIAAIGLAAGFRVRGFVTIPPNRSG
jgi:hypothetical protein